MPPARPDYVPPPSYGTNPRPSMANPGLPGPFRSSTTPWSSPSARLRQPYMPDPSHPYREGLPPGAYPRGPPGAPPGYPYHHARPPMRSEEPPYLPPRGSDPAMDAHMRALQDKRLAMAGVPMGDRGVPSPGRGVPHGRPPHMGPPGAMDPIR